MRRFVVHNKKKFYEKLRKQNFKSGNSNEMVVHDEQQNIIKKKYIIDKKNSEKYQAVDKRLIHLIKFLKFKKKLTSLSIFDDLSFDLKLKES